MRYFGIWFLFQKIIHTFAILRNWDNTRYDRLFLIRTFYTKFLIFETKKYLMICTNIPWWFIGQGDYWSRIVWHTIWSTFKRTFWYRTIDFIFIFKILLPAFSDDSCFWLGTVREHFRRVDVGLDAELFLLALVQLCNLYLLWDDRLSFVRTLDAESFIFIAFDDVSLSENLVWEGFLDGENGPIICFGTPFSIKFTFGDWAIGFILVVEIAGPLWSLSYLSSWCTWAISNGNCFPDAFLKCQHGVEAFAFLGNLDLRCDTFLSFGFALYTESFVLISTDFISQGWYLPGSFVQNGCYVSCVIRGAIRSLFESTFFNWAICIIWIREVPLPA